MARVHYHEFYCFDNVPLELEDDEGNKVTVQGYWIKSGDEMEFTRRLEKEIENDLGWLGACEPHASDWWIVYWNNGDVGTHRGVGKKPKVMN